VRIVLAEAFARAGRGEDQSAICTALYDQYNTPSHVHRRGDIQSKVSPSLAKMQCPTLPACAHWATRHSFREADKYSKEL
jgi:hypothetical protein